jgi:hypothetical protein
MHPRWKIASLVNGDNQTGTSFGSLQKLPTLNETESFNPIDQQDGLVLGTGHCLLDHRWMIGRCLGKKNVVIRDVRAVKLVGEFVKQRRFTGALVTDDCRSVSQRFQSGELARPVVVGETISELADTIESQGVFASRQKVGISLGGDFVGQLRAH